jgi:D-beta-D-heptose 7-phosphate kinase/D-beta-D-heptose 1-phosphate adenosyltransferase
LEDDVANLHSLLQGTSFLVTLGAEGVSLFWSDAKAVHIPAQARGVFDVTGAGDTFAATLALALGAGAALAEAAIMANAAAGVVVGKIGTAVVESSELEAAMKQL